jgi:hypothetical protein
MVHTLHDIAIHYNSVQLHETAAAFVKCERCGESGRSHSWATKIFSWRCEESQKNLITERVPAEIRAENFHTASQKHCHLSQCFNCMMKSVHPWVYPNTDPNEGRSILARGTVKNCRCCPMYQRYFASNFGAHWGSKILRNVGRFLPCYTTSQFGIQHIS